MGFDWCISFLIVPARSCSLGSPLLYHTPVASICFKNFNSAMPVDVIRVKSNMRISTGIVELKFLKHMDAYGAKTQQEKFMVQQRPAKGTTSLQNNEDQNAPITADYHYRNDAAQPVDLIA